MLKSRALPDSFDTTQVLRSPFDNKLGPEGAFPSPRHFLAPGSDPHSHMLSVDGLQRPSDDDYTTISPLSSASTNGNYISSASTHKSSDGFSQPGSRTSLSERVDMQRNGTNAMPFARTSGLSESLNAELSNNGFSRPGVGLGHPGMPYARRTMDYSLDRRRSGIMAGYDQRALEGSVSPSGSHETPIQYNGDNQGTSSQSTARYYSDLNST